MFLRNVLEYRFIDLQNNNEKEAFCLALTKLPYHIAWSTLLNQYQVGSDNLAAIASFITDLKNRKPFQLNQNANMIFELLYRIQATTELLKHQYISLSLPVMKQQYILGLLMLEPTARNEMMAILSEDKQNIVALSKDLYDAPPEMEHLYKLFPCYKSFVAEMCGILKSVNPTLNSEEHLLRTALSDYVQEATLFDDSTIGMETINEPYVTPHGLTYEKNEIIEWIFANHIEPNTRAKTQVSDLVPNHLFATLKKILERPPSLIDLDKLYEALLCPISGEVLKEPVIAANGHTYSRAFIESYLEENNRLPDGTHQGSRPLIENRSLKKLFNEEMPTPFKTLIQRAQQSQQEKMGPALTSYWEKNHAYLETRVHEKKFAGSILGKSKMAKINQATLFAKLLEGKISLPVYKVKADSKVANYGRLGKNVVVPGLQEYNKQKFGKR